MSYQGQVTTIRVLHRLLQDRLGDVARLDIEIEKTVRQFGEADPMVARLREKLAKAERHLTNAQAAYDKEMAKL